MTTKLSLREVANRHDVNRERVRQADAVLDHAEELADAVMAGTVPLNDAYAEAKQRKEQRQSREEQAKRDERDLLIRDPAQRAIWRHGAGGFTVRAISELFRDSALSTHCA